MSRKIDGEINPEDLRVLEEHVLNCTPCREQYRVWKSHSRHASDGLQSLWPQI
jgi:predicted anti-sigma-YlaC factor YlaD